MSKFLLSTAILVFLLCAPSAAIAGPDEDMRDAARAEAAKLRADGWPKQGCLAGVSFSKNAIVKGNGNILAGDKILYIKDTNVEKATLEEIAEAFGSTPPNGIIAIQVRRDNKVLNIEQECGNLADYQQPYLQALDFAGNKKWYDCIEVLASKPDDQLYLNLSVRCARVSRKAAEYPIEQWMNTIAQQSVAQGKYASDDWKDIADSLLKYRINVSSSVYDSLVNEVRAWDDGKTWDSVQPDYSIMRRAAESGVKSHLIDPQSAMIEMPYDFIYGSWYPAFTRTSFEGFMTCGTVNAKNRMGGYTGSTFFISVVDEAGFVKYTDMDSSTSGDSRIVANSCAQLIMKLKFAGNLPDDQKPAPASQVDKASIAQELEKLSELHANGALTDEEYTAAKSRVLSKN
jgi:hypothetical protein